MDTARDANNCLLPHKCEMVQHDWNYTDIAGFYREIALVSDIRLMSSKREKEKIAATRDHYTDAILRALCVKHFDENLPKDTRMKILRTSMRFTKHRQFVKLSYSPSTL